MTDALVILTTLPDRESALKLGQTLVERRLAACVSVLGECQSIYRWKGEIERAFEVPVLVKTRAARYEDVEAAIRELHPYELPEILALPSQGGSEEYLQWIAGETAIAIG